MSYYDLNELKLKSYNELQNAQISGNLRNLEIDYCNRIFTGIALLYPVLTEVMQALPYLA